jgi:PPM family protein phosphatase
MEEGMVRAAVQVCTQSSSDHPSNEDRVTIGSQVLSSTTGAERAWLQPPATVAVLDGVGGAPCAELASQLAAQVISAPEAPRTGEEARALFKRADRVLLDAGQLDFSRAGMATTASMLVLLDDDGTAIAINVGDSLLAYLDGDRLHEVSASDRIGSSKLFQTLGGFDDAAMNPHVAALELAVGDRLLLATDGLTDTVSADTIASVLCRHDTDAAARLLDLARQAGKPDDVTIMVVDVIDDD